MILKRPKNNLVKSPRAAMKYIDDYMAEERKHKGEDLEKLGMGIGKRYFTSRPVGAVTAHGYAKKRTAELAISGDLKGNAAVRAFLWEQCRDRAMKKRKVYGLRFIMSLNPEKTVELAANLVDIDRLLIRAIEDSFAAIEAQFYPNDELGYLVGIHHDAVTRARDQKPSRPHMHAHVFVLPQTKKGLRVSFSNHTSPLRDGQYHDVLDAFREAYQVMTQKHIYSLNVSPKRLPNPGGWTAMVKECALHTMDDLRVGAKINDAVERRDYIVRKFAYYLTSTDRNGLRLRHNLRMEELLKRANQPTEKRWRTLNHKLESLTEELKKFISGHAEELNEPSQWTANRDHLVQLWTFDAPKGMLLRKPAKPAPNRSSRVKELFQLIADRRHAAQIQTVSLVAKQELELASLMGEIPEWVDAIGELSSSSTPMPNQEIYRAPGEITEPLPPTLPAAPAVEPSPSPAPLNERTPEIKPVKADIQPPNESPSSPGLR